jgi:YD repeat-containing protein
MRGSENQLVAGCHAANRLVTSTQGSATTTYTFDKVGNLTQEALGAGSSLYSLYGSRRPLVKQRWRPRYELHLGDSTTAKFRKPRNPGG